MSLRSYGKTRRERKLLRALGYALERERDLGERIRQLEDQVLTLEAQRDGFPDPIPAEPENRLPIGEWRTLELVYGRQSLCELRVRVRQIDMHSFPARCHAIVEFDLVPEGFMNGSGIFSVML